MTTANQQQEPSMEEILSSIRRIISDEQEDGEPTPEAKPPQAETPIDPAAAALAVEPDANDGDANDKDDVLDLTEVVVEGDAKATKDSDAGDGPNDTPTEETANEAAPAMNEIDRDDVEMEPVHEDKRDNEEALSADADQEPAMVSAPAHEDEPKVGTGVAETILSDATAAASTSAMAKLAKVASGDHNRKITDGDKSVEAFLTALIEPMLKEWLDANLNTIVERVVEQEVKKLARRAELM